MFGSTVIHRWTLQASRRSQAVSTHASSSQPPSFLLPSSYSAPSFLSSPSLIILAIYQSSGVISRPQQECGTSLEWITMCHTHKGKLPLPPLPSLSFPLFYFLNTQCFSCSKLSNVQDLLCYGPYTFLGRIQSE